jgi:TonB family protein
VHAPATAKAARPTEGTVSLAAPPPGAPATGGAIPLHVRTQVAPQLPQKARDQGVKSGHVTVVLRVDPEGRVQRVELVDAKPPETYDTAMEQAFSQWTFDPPGVWGRMTVDIDIVPPHP